MGICMCLYVAWICLHISFENIPSDMHVSKFSQIRGHIWMSKDQVEVILNTKLYVAYLLVQSLATRSCSSRFWLYWLAIEPTSGSAGLQSVSSEQIESKTLDMVSAGDQLSLSMSRHMTPWLLTLQWYIRVRKVTFGGLNGYSGEKCMSRKKTPPSYGEPGGPSIVDTHSYKLSPLGPALQLGGGSRVISASSFWIL